MPLSLALFLAVLAAASFIIQGPELVIRIWGVSLGFGFRVVLRLIQGVTYSS